MKYATIKDILHYQTYFQQQVKTYDQRIGELREEIRQLLIQQDTTVLWKTQTLIAQRKALQQELDLAKEKVEEHTLLLKEQSRDLQDDTLYHNQKIFDSEDIGLRNYQALGAQAAKAKSLHYLHMIYENLRSPEARLSHDQIVKIKESFQDTISLFMETGSGKTLTAGAFLSYLYELRNRFEKRCGIKFPLRMLVLTDKINLIDQIKTELTGGNVVFIDEEKIAKEVRQGGILEKEKVERMQQYIFHSRSEERQSITPRDDTSDLTVFATLKTAAIGQNKESELYALLGGRHFDFVVCDEAHHTPANTYATTYNYYANELNDRGILPLKVLLTATPDQDLLAISGDPTFRFGFVDYVLSGFAPEINYHLRSKKPLSNLYIKELEEKIAKLHTMQHDEQAAFLKELNEEMEMLLGKFESYDELVDDLLSPEVLSDNPEQTIIFVPSIKEAHYVKHLINTKLGKDVADALTCAVAKDHDQTEHEEEEETSPDTKEWTKINQYYETLKETKFKDDKEILLNYKKGKTKILIAVDKLNEGIDVPSTQNIVFLRESGDGTKVYNQQRGRGARGKSVTYFDYVCALRNLIDIAMINRVIWEKSEKKNSVRSAIKVIEGNTGEHNGMNILDIQRIVNLNKSREETKQIIKQNSLYSSEFLEQIHEFKNTCRTHNKFWIIPVEELHKYVRISDEDARKISSNQEEYEAFLGAVYHCFHKKLNENTRNWNEIYKSCWELFETLKKTSKRKKKERREKFSIETFVIQKIFHLPSISFDEEVEVYAVNEFTSIIWKLIWHGFIYYSIWKNNDDITGSDEEIGMLERNRYSDRFTFLMYIEKSLTNSHVARKLFNKEKKLKTLLRSLSRIYQAKPTWALEYDEYLHDPCSDPNSLLAVIHYYFNTPSLEFTQKKDHKTILKEYQETLKEEYTKQYESRYRYPYVELNYHHFSDLIDLSEELFNTEFNPSTFNGQQRLKGLYTFLRNPHNSDQDHLLDCVVHHYRGDIFTTAQEIFEIKSFTLKTKEQPNLSKERQAALEKLSYFFEYNRSNYEAILLQLSLNMEIGWLLQELQTKHYLEKVELLLERLKDFLNLESEWEHEHYENDSTRPIKKKEKFIGATLYLLNTEKYKRRANSKGDYFGYYEETFGDLLRNAATLFNMNIKWEGKRFDPYTFKSDYIQLIKKYFDQDNYILWDNSCHLEDEEKIIKLGTQEIHTTLNEYFKSQNYFTSPHPTYEELSFYAQIDKDRYDANKETEKIISLYCSLKYLTTGRARKKLFNQCDPQQQDSFLSVSWQHYCEKRQGTDDKHRLKLIGEITGHGPITLRQLTPEEWEQEETIKTLNKIFLDRKRILIKIHGKKIFKIINIKQLGSEIWFKIDNTELERINYFSWKDKEALLCAILLLKESNASKLHPFNHETTTKILQAIKRYDIIADQRTNEHFIELIKKHFHLESLTFI